MHSADHLLNAEDLQTIRRLEENLWRAETRCDNALMDEIFAPDFVEFGRSGRIYTRKEMFFAPDPSRTIDAVLPLPEFRARYLSEGVIQVTYVSDVDHDGKRSRANRSSVWSRTPKGWQLRFHQGTPL